MQKDQSKLFKILGAEIRKRRILKEMTLEDMQDHGFSSAHFQKIEAGKKAINLYTAYRIALALKTKLSDLIKIIE
jgi:hypothetical protein